MWGLAVITLAVAVVAAAGAGDSEDEDAGPVWPKKPYSNQLTFKEDDYKEAFQSLDLNNDGHINIEDLRKYYFHKDSDFAIHKFIQLMDTANNPGKIDLEEFTKFMDKDPVKRQAHEISFGTTVELRQRYYADEILTYVYLVMDQHAIEVLFDSIESPDRKDGKLDFIEVREMQMKLMDGNAEYKLSEDETKLVLAELSGAGSETVSKEDFKEYLLDGSLSFLFRECRKKVTTTGAEYDNACLIRKLIRYITKYLTEYMMTLMFVALDFKSKDNKVSVKDIQEIFHCKEDDAKTFILYAGSGNQVLYEDFHSMLMIGPIKRILETKCMSEPVAELNDRVVCLNKEFYDLSRQSFFPKTISVPDLDIIFLFEDLDTSDDGTIKQNDDLEEGKGWPTGLAKKFMAEVGPPENNEKVNLDDFFHYIYEPYMMCALGECQVAKDNKEKLNCYNNELKDMITSVLIQLEVDAFFGFYGYNIIYRSALQKFGLSDERMTNYLIELGHGNLFVTEKEFKLFVKQQDPSHLFSTDENVVPKKHFEPSQLHEKLLWHVEHQMTHFDIKMLFRALDVNRNRLIDENDVAQVNEIDAELLGKMALYGNKEHATFQEFWMFLNSKAPGDEKPRKHLLEGCAQINQDEQTNCFKGKLKSLQ